MGKQRSLRSKAVSLVSDFTTVLLNPISDKPSKKPPIVSDNEADLEKTHIDSNCEEESLPSAEGPDTSSFTAFLYSLLKDDYFSAEREDFNKPPVKAENDSESGNETSIGPEIKTEEPIEEPRNIVREGGGKRGIISRGRQSIGKAMSYATRLAWFRNYAQVADRRQDSEVKCDEKIGSQDGGSLRPTEREDELLSLSEKLDMSEKSLLLSQKTQIILYASLPALVKGRKWVLLYSTWRDGISLGTLYRKSMLCPGLSLLVVGDRGGAVFGGLVEAPLRPSKSRKYQGSNSTFIFTDALGQPVIYRPTGANRYYTLCSPDFLALGGGSHFALYLDSDLLNGSSAASDTYGNSCLALSEDFVVKEVELWGFVYASRYEEILALGQNELPGICRW